MKKLLFLLLLFLFLAPRTMAFEITEDPQYVVINFADFYFADWKAQESKWQTEVKPKLRQKIRDLKTVLTVGNDTRKLAWSTLLEYMDFAEVPGTAEPAYVLQARRIMELAEDEDLPAFVPLNGVQWWNEQPELWNYWDNDGNQTPGCTNADYANCPFAKLRDPAYRKRFIAGYNPDNKWNVDWKDWQTPMSFNTRNWGGGDVLVAPSPNIGTRLKPNAFRSMQTKRFGEILDAISAKLAGWETNKKQYLFAGISIGTEVSLNGSVIPGDENFRPFGFRVLQDRFCPKDNLTCGEKASWTADQLHTMRKTVLSEYFDDFARLAAGKGLPKSRIYTHVWSEALPGERKYTDAIGASVTRYSRPGMSLYGKAEAPLEFPLLRKMLEDNGYPQWAAPEFSPLIRETENWQRALNNTLGDTRSAAKLVDIYNERDILGTPAIPVIRTFMQSKYDPVGCRVSEAIPVTITGKTLEWRLLEKDDAASQNVRLYRSVPPHNNTPAFTEKTTLPAATSLPLKELNLPPGLYYASIRRSGCGGARWTESTPRPFMIEETRKQPNPLVSLLLKLLGR